MDSDQRVHNLIEIIEYIKEGNFNVNFTTEDQDEISRLGNAIIDLGKLLERRFLEMKKLLNVTSKVNSGLLLEEVLDYLFDNFRDLIPYNRIGCSFLSDDAKLLTAKWARSDADKIYISKGYSCKMEGSTLQKIIETNEPRIINDLEKYFENKQDSESTKLVLKEGVLSSLTCPLIVNAKPVGFIFFSSFQRFTYSGLHVSLFQQIAGQISVIIEKSKLYSEILDQKKKLEELNEVKNRFLGIAAHDLRNPLGVILGFSELLLNEEFSFSKDEILEIYENINSSAVNMLNLVNDFLDVSKIESGTFDINISYVDFNSYISDIVKKNRLISKNKSIELELSCDPEIDLIEFDPGRMNQVFNNLLTNAIKYSYENSIIKIKCELRNNNLVVDVVDSGIGIKESDYGAIFSGYFSKGVKGTAGEKSTGLGLAICKKIIDAHHGELSVKSEYGKGSTFTVVLPLKNSGS